jgi:hypothetical protein
VNAEQVLLVDTLLACCDRLSTVEEAPLGYLDDVAKVCALLRPLLADADTPEELALQNLVWRTEEWVLTWVLRGRYAEQGLPEWLPGDSEADFVAWEQARVELAELRGEAS